MSKMPSEPVLRWAADAVGAGANVVAVKGLHEGSSPWLLRIEHGGSTREVVLRVAGRIFPWQIATGAAALRVAEAHGLAAPRLIASDLDGRDTGGVPATLETAVPGSSAMPNKVSPERLRAAGAAIAKVHKVPLEPRRELPLKVHSLQNRSLADERPMERRWATLYRASADSEKTAVVHALCELTGWDADRAREVMTGTHSTPFLQLADDKVRSIPRPQGETVFVHADLWAGNMMWNGDSDVTLIDWKDAGVGDPGVDLGHLRMKMAVQYGADAAAQVLDGWQRESGRLATNLAYWDAVAALHTPADLDDWEPRFDEEGNQLSSAATTARRDAFLRAALDQLDHEGAAYE
ncbi:MAG: phosphotransferase family protein [Chloroflexota bacterium]